MADRRTFIKLSGLSLLGAAMPAIPRAFAPSQPFDRHNVDYTIEIALCREFLPGTQAQQFIAYS
jgi:hypothetical protein